VPLTVGARIIHKERIHTTPTGTVQLAFLDKSTLSIAPNTSIVINEFIYDPDSGNGHMLASLTQGALRFVDGALSHQGDASIATPAAAIGIRGGTVSIVFGPNGAEIINHFGIITIHNGAGTVTINRPDFKVLVLNWNTLPGPIERVLVPTSSTCRGLPACRRRTAACQACTPLISASAAYLDCAATTVPTCPGCRPTAA
jgi:hypothetical protein